MKCLGCLFLALVILLGGCGKAESILDTSKIQITTMQFVAYDWLREIVGEDNENIQLNLINDTGTDLHSYQPKVQDVALMSNSDLLVYTGGESEEWIEDSIKDPANKDLKALSLLQILGDQAYIEEVKEGMVADEEEEEEAYDEHVWLSVKNAIIFVQALKEQVIALDPAHASTYEANAAAYLARLKNLDKQYSKAVKEAKSNTLIFADRFAFRYLVEDYGLDYDAAYLGCSADTQVTFHTITTLAKDMDEANAQAIIVVDNSDESLAATVLEYTADPHRPILRMNSLQAATKSQIKEGLNYYDIMKDNLAVLKKALN